MKTVILKDNHFIFCKGDSLSNLSPCTFNQWLKSKDGIKSPSIQFWKDLIHSLIKKAPAEKQEPLLEKVEHYRNEGLSQIEIIKKLTKIKEIGAIPKSGIEYRP